MVAGTRTRRDTDETVPSRGGERRRERSGERRLRPVVRSEMDPMVAQRRRQVRADQLRRRRRKLFVAAAVVVVVAAVIAVALSPLLRVRHVRISGNSHLDVAEIEDLAAVDHGTALLRADVAGITERLEHDPWIANARVRRSHPTTLLVEITEERPLMVLQTEHGVALIARTGRILEFAADEGSARFIDGDLPLVSMKGRIAKDSPSDADLPGRRGSDDVIELSRVVRNLPSAVESRLERVDASDPTAIDLVMDDGSTVLVGPSEDVSAKMAALSAVLTGVDDRCVDHIDVRNPKRVTVTRTDDCAMPD